MSDDRFVGKPQHAIACRCQEGFTLDISRNLRFVDASIDLDDKPTFSTTEIDDERSDWMLATKLQPGQSPIPERAPKQGFRASLSCAQFPRIRDIEAMTVVC